MSLVVAETAGRRDLGPFSAEMPWDKRLDLIKRTFSCTPLMGPESAETEAAWRRAFDRDVELLGRILRDVLKSDQAVAGRPGPRPSLDRKRAEPTVDEWMGRDPMERPYTMLGFADAFRMLVGKRSLRHVANSVGLSYKHVDRLLKGASPPTRVVMERVSKAFGKEPSFFVEWRAGVVAVLVAQKLSESPEQSVRAYEAMFW